MNSVTSEATAREALRDVGPTTGAAGGVPSAEEVETETVGEITVDDPRIRTRLDRFRGRVDRSQHDVTAERDGALGWRDGVVLGMAGMRGVVTIAAAQTLPGDHPLYEPLVLIDVDDVDLSRMLLGGLVHDLVLP